MGGGGLISGGFGLNDRATWARRRGGRRGLELAGVPLVGVLVRQNEREDHQGEPLACARHLGQGGELGDGWNVAGDEEQRRLATDAEGNGHRGTGESGRRGK